MFEVKRFFRHFLVHVFTFTAVNNHNQVTVRPHIQGNCKRGRTSVTLSHVRGKSEYCGKTTNKHTRMDFIVKFQTWACHRLYGLGSDWSSFIHKSWKESMHTQHMEVFFLNQVHMVALLSTAARHAQSWERQEALGLCAQQKWFLRHWYLMEGEEPSTTAISRALPHMEAIISNGVLRQFPQLKKEITGILIPGSPRPFSCY